ncbi:MAG: hypothetical protein NTU49_01975, partial [Gammaproteobacteria bacterium]|nr:hypothetical protein [Gammaproteobacteria bacterium]
FGLPSLGFGFFKDAGRNGCCSFSVIAIFYGGLEFVAFLGSSKKEPYLFVDYNVSGLVICSFDCDIDFSDPGFSRYIM